MKFRSSLFFFCALAGQFVLTSAVHAEIRYTVTDLGTLGGANSSAASVNSSGQVVGTAKTAYGVDRAFVYYAGQMYDLGTLGGNASSAAAINELGDVVGYATNAAGDEHAFLFSKGNMQDLGTLGGPSSHANSINNLGQIVGGADLPSKESRAFFYVNGVMTDMGTLGGNFSEAFSINDPGIIIGESYITPPQIPLPLFQVVSHAFVFTAGTMYDLAALGGPTTPLVIPSQINQNNIVIGYSLTGATDYSPRTFAFWNGTTVYPTSTTKYPVLKSINSSAQAVGSQGDGRNNAILISGGVITQLADLVTLSGSGFVNLTVAYAISDNGYIVGTGDTTAGTSHAFLLTPLPTLAP